MDQITNLLNGFGDILTPENLVFVFVGALMGTAVGVLPGLGSAMAVALLLPLTASLDPLAALAMLSAIYFGGLFGDSIAGILMNTPGNSTAIASSLEGHRMALSGRAPQALATAALGAFIGGIISTLIVVFFAPALADAAVKFGPAEYFALAVFAFVAIATVVSDSAIRGLAALAIGLAIAMVGIDQPTGTERFTFGLRTLFDGIDIVVLTVALLALGEVFHQASRIGRSDEAKLLPTKGRPFLSRAEFRQALPAWLRGTGFGVPFGVIPVGGAEVPTFLSYGTERALDRRRAEPTFGNGSIQGVAGPEAAGNATAGTAMGALLALGLPTSATAAVMLIAFRQYGMQPGPLLFERNADIVWALLASLFIGMVALLILNLPLAPMWAQLLKLPKAYLYAGISLLASFGVYATAASTTDLLLMFGLGLLGFAMRRYDVPIAPVLIGVILGPLAEYNLRDAMGNSGNDPFVLVSSPITIVLYVLLAAGVVWGLLRRRRAASSDF
ncbi:MULTISPECIES: tripartite tricarboxylate transporter permease [Janibacter]|uniref:tripartite tricarboxylate transporter permease n=1 Tax=Janibacter TaxID=53457 RepID=UPI0021A5CF40|nr:tripartite tricarboxylate transporter permease [Janibacter hoylei]MCT1618237.1 tripartite tricarboxylate transporter permease [Janibacter hoylei]MCT2293676.1 tripartite tricarboxylate transporter permease [Janibacter hoylei]MCW4601473.1 tripartite tricarboxylate transporter permease [Janibacter hoylei]